MQTGEIEIVADDIKVLNRCNATLPFHIHDFHEVYLSLLVTACIYAYWIDYNFMFVQKVTCPYLSLW